MIVRTLSEGLTLTFHRAFDMCSDRESALESILRCNCDRLLTSGQETAALQAAENGSLQEILQRVHGLMVVVAAAGITIENASHIIQKSNVTALHVGSAVTAWTSFQPSMLSDAVGEVGGSPCDAPEMLSYMRVDCDKVRKLVTVSEKCWVELKLMEVPQTSPFD